MLKLKLKKYEQNAREILADLRRSQFGRAKKVPATLGCLQPGGVLLEEEPFAYVLLGDRCDDYCHFCFKHKRLLETEQLLECTNCRCIRYCSVGCWLADKSNHQLECIALRRNKPDAITSTMRLVMRVIVWARDNAADTVYKSRTDKYTRKYHEMMTHEAELKDRVMRVKQVKMIHSLINAYWKRADKVPSIDEITRTLGLALTNSFHINDKHMVSIGVGIYMGASRIDHCCTSNATASFVGKRIYIRNLEPVDLPVDWSKIFISYIDPFAPREMRRQQLNYAYCFQCQCQRCQDEEEEVEMNAGHCPNPLCEQPINFSAIKSWPGKCPDCGASIRRQHMETFVDQTEANKVQLYRMMSDMKTYKDVCDVLLRKQIYVLYKFNIWRLRVEELEFGSALDRGDHRTAITLGKTTLDAYKKYVGYANPILGLYNMRMAKVYATMENWKKALECAIAGADITRINNGMNHPLFEDAMQLLNHCASKGKIALPTDEIP